MTTNETARAAAFASQADRSRELTAGYVDQMIALSRAVRDMRDGTVQAITSMQIPHRWMGTRLELLVDGQWVPGPDLAGKDARGVKKVEVVEGRLVLTYDDDEIIDLGSVAGDVVGPDVSTDGHIALFEGVTGKIIKDSGKSLADLATAEQGAKADTAVQPDDIGTAALDDAEDFATALQGTKADTALQPDDVGVTVQAHSAILDATEVSFTTALKAKLDGVEGGAEVNVNADWAAESGKAKILNVPEFGTAAFLDAGLSAGNVVQLDLTGRLPQLDGSLLTDIALADPFSTALLHVRDEKATGTSGGTSVVGWQTRALNTVLTNEISGATLSSNQITLPAGTYFIEAKASQFGQMGGTQARLYNVTEGASILVGETATNQGLNARGGAPVRGRFVLSSSKVVRLEQYAAGALADGLGKAASSTAGEVYSECMIWKVA